MTSEIPANPFDPSASHVPDVLRRLFDAVDDIQREYPAGASEEAWESIGRSCKKANSILKEILAQKQQVIEGRLLWQCAMSGSKS